MPARRLLSEAQHSRLEALPEMDERELARHHTLSETDLAAASVRRGAANRLGFAVQLCRLRYPGRPLRVGRPERAPETWRASFEPGLQAALRLLRPSARSDAAWPARRL